MPRTFIAILLPEQIKLEIQRHIDVLSLILPHERYTTWDTWHVTLSFPGEVDDLQMAATHDIVRNIVAHHHRFTLALGNLGTFYDEGHPRVIWLGVTGMLEDLKTLQKDIIHELTGQEIPHHIRDEYRPHITLARVANTLSQAEQRALSQLHVAHESLSFDVNEIAVMKSEKTSTGSHYTVLEVHTLKAK